MPFLHLKTYFTVSAFKESFNGRRTLVKYLAKKKALIMGKVVSVPPGGVGEDGEALLDHNVGPGHGAVQSGSTHLIQDHSHLACLIQSLKAKLERFTLFKRNKPLGEGLQVLVSTVIFYTFPRQNV
jgi:hypothetical protein